MPINATVTPSFVRTHIAIIVILTVIYDSYAIRVKRERQIKETIDKLIIKLKLNVLIELFYADPAIHRS